jgi:hypothetical protein
MLWFHDKFYQEISREDLQKFYQRVLKGITGTYLSLEPEEADVVEILQEMIKQEKGYDRGKEVS